jgi:3-oxoacyl-[acyl-carrier-protein] synthase I
MDWNEVYINQSNCVTPLGFDVKSNFEALISGKTGIQKSEDYHQPAYISKMEDDLLNQKFLEISKEPHFSKLEKMMILALHPLVRQNRIDKNTPLFVSTTKGNIEDIGNAEQSGALLTQLAQNVADFFEFTQKPIVISNACVSGLLAVAVAKRTIQAGAYQNAFIVAADVVSEFVLSGFHSFQAVSEFPCKPYDANRSGITLGEAAAAAYISSEKIENRQNTLIKGDGTVNDANHISGPSRTGEGLYKSIVSAMKEADLKSTDIDFISAHGTATPYNDEMEAIALNRLELQNAPMHSLKGYFGHTLGASGLLETVLAIESAFQNRLIPSMGFENLGLTKPLNVIRNAEEKEIHRFLKTASGFGGCNTAVIFEKVN